MRVYVIWDPIFGGYFDSEAKNLSRSFPDKRVSYYKDPDSLAGNLWKGVLRIERDIAWDVYLLYGPDAQWEKEPAHPEFWMHQLFGVTNAPPLDTEKLTEELKGLLDNLEPEDSKERKQSKENMRIELLYFNSCPSYKRALANIKAALKEKKLQAELKLINVETEEQAEKVGFQGSPSVRINGKDLEGRDEGFSFSCRLYYMNGKPTVAPSKEAIIAKLESLMK